MESFQNISTKAKDLNAGSNVPINEYITDVKLQAEDLVMNKFPQKVLEIEALLKTPNFNVSDISSVYNEWKMVVPDSDCDNQDKINPRKRRKLDKAIHKQSDSIHSTLSNNCDGDNLDQINSNKQNDCPESTQSKNYDELGKQCNDRIIGVIELLKPCTRQLLEEIKILKMWIEFLSPQMEETNDKIESILDVMYGESQVIEESAAAYSNQISTYFQSRGKIVAKIMKHPDVYDYQRCIRELDEDFHLRIRDKLCEIRNYYATFHDLISKNWEFIKRPQTFNPNIMFG